MPFFVENVTFLPGTDDTGSKDWRLEHSLMKDQIVTTARGGTGGKS